MVENVGNWKMGRIDLNRPKSTNDHRKIKNHPNWTKTGPARALTCAWGTQVYTIVFEKIFEKILKDFDFGSVFGDVCTFSY